jgi:hypothetical protein
MSMIHDHETLLMKMEAENGIMDDGQQLLNNTAIRWMFLHL